MAYKALDWKLFGGGLKSVVGSKIEKSAHERKWEPTKSKVNSGPIARLEGNYVIRIEYTWIVKIRVG